MTDKKLKELLIVIDNRYGRVRSKEDRMLQNPKQSRAVQII